MLCNGVQWCAMVCNVMQCYAMVCNVMQWYAMSHNVANYCVMQWCAMVCNVMQWCAMLCNVANYSAMQWCAMLCNGVQCYAMVCNVVPMHTTPCYKMHKWTKCHPPNLSHPKKIDSIHKSIWRSPTTTKQQEQTCRAQLPKQRPRTARPVTPSGNVRTRTQDPPRWTFRSPSLCNRRSHSTRCANCVTKSQPRSTTKAKTKSKSKSTKTKSAKSKSTKTNCCSGRRSTGKWYAARPSGCDERTNRLNKCFQRSTRALTPRKWRNWKAFCRPKRCGARSSPFRRWWPRFRTTSPLGVTEVKKRERERERERDRGVKLTN